jgi:hypothetical protein
MQKTRAGADWITQIFRINKMACPIVFRTMTKINARLRDIYKDPCNYTPETVVTEMSICAEGNAQNLLYR